jgi:peptide/nickel transport system ATP-binding protein
MENLLSIKNLTIKFHTYDSTVTAVDDIHLTIGVNETYGLVGETGCGKTVTALSVLRLVPSSGRIERGNVQFLTNSGGLLELLDLDENEMRELRGNKISMIFQEPSSALDPVYTIGDQISESILLHRKIEVAENVLSKIDLPPGNFLKRILAILVKPIEKEIYSTIIDNPETNISEIIARIPVIRNLLWRSHREANEMAVTLLKNVEIPDAGRVVHQYPHELSGGMKQRCVIAIALACNPRLLIADEPTTALDVTIQAQILDLLNKLKEESNMSILYITHDLSVAAEICDRVGVMYAGSICEEADVVELYENPLHPYTKALLAAVPKPGELPHSVIGTAPDLSEPSEGCAFYPRCSIHEDICLSGKPKTVEIMPGHFVTCHLC